MLCEHSYRKAIDSLARGTRAEMALGSSSNPIWFTICLVGIRIRQARREMQRRRAVCAVLLFICSAHLADRFDCGEAVREQREWNDREGYWNGDLRQRWYLNDAHTTDYRKQLCGKLAMGLGCGLVFRIINLAYIYICLIVVKILEFENRNRDWQLKLKLGLYEIRRWLNRERA